MWRHPDVPQSAEVAAGAKVEQYDYTKGHNAAKTNERQAGAEGQRDQTVYCARRSQSDDSVGDMCDDSKAGLAKLQGNQSEETQ